MKPSQAVLNLLKSIEIKALKPYLCSAGVATISYGVTYYEDGRGVKLSDPAISEERCEQLFINTLQKYADSVNKIITKPMTQQQFDAFLLMCYNCGVPAFSRPAQVAKWFNLGNLAQVKEWWIKSFITSQNTGDKPVPGLVNRRKCEWQIFESGIYKKW